MLRRVAKAVASPLRTFFNPRFESLNGRLIALSEQEDRSMAAVREHVVQSAAATQRQVAELAAAIHRHDDPSILTGRQAAELRQADYLNRVNLREHNRGGRPPTFDELVCQAPSADQCDDPRFHDWGKLLEEWGDSTVDVDSAHRYHRKVWEFAFIAESVVQAGLMQPGHRAVGFGVGNEPLPALFASRGLDVLATDWTANADGRWATSGELNVGLAGLFRPHLLSDETLATRVRVRDVDMNQLPDDLGTFDVAWSACVIEHLGNPRRGLDFVLKSCDLLRPGGIAVHTTELELTARTTTADYGNCAVYRVRDLLALAERLPDHGCTATFNFTVAMDRPQDRWISLQAIGGSAALPDIAHLKLAIGDSVSTSFGLLIHKQPS